MALTKVTGQVIKNTTDVTVGVLTVTNTLAVGGTVSIGGTLTYEDVTNVDAVGLITARNGIVVGSGITLSKDGDGFFTGVITATSYSGIDLSNVTGAQGDFSIADKIVHTGDTNTALRFPAADTFTVETGGSERVRIDSSGNLAQGTATPTTPDSSNADNSNNGLVFTMYGDSPAINLIHNTSGGSAASDDYSAINFGRAGSSSNPYRAVIGYKQDGDALHINAQGSIKFDIGGDINSGEAMRIVSNGSGGGRLLIGTTTEGEASADDLTIAGSGNQGITIRSGTSNYGLIYFSDATSGTGEYDGAIEYKHSDNFMVFRTGASERLRIDSSGRLMIGTTDATIADSGADDFVISRAGHAGITIDATSSTNSSVFFADGPTGTEAYRGFVQYSHSTDTLKLGASGADQVEISAGNVEITDGDLVIGTAGHGISFGITANGSGTTNGELLNDYEIGQFTPVISNGWTSPTYDVQRGGYVLVGKICHVQLSIRLTGGTGTGAVFQIGGLPFSSYNGAAYTTGGVNVGYQEGVFSGDKSFHIAQNVTVIRVYNNNGTPFTGNQTTIVNKYLNFFGSYIVNH